MDQKLHSEGKRIQLIKCYLTNCINNYLRKFRSIIIGHKKGATIVAPFLFYPINFLIL